MILMMMNFIILYKNLNLDYLLVDFQKITAVSSVLQILKRNKILVRAQTHKTIFLV